MVILYVIKMSSWDDTLCELVKAISEHTNCRKRSVGCIIYNVKTDEVVARGCNEHIDGICDCLDSKERKGTAIHAEVMAITDLNSNENKDDLIAYVTHKPCCNCASALDNYVKEVRYRSQHVS